MLFREAQVKTRPEAPYHVSRRILSRLFGVGVAGVRVNYPVAVPGTALVALVLPSSTS